MERGLLAAAFGLILAILPLGPAAAEVPRPIMAPVELAARDLPPDIRLPSTTELARIAELEAMLRVDLPCNRSWDLDREPERRELLALHAATWGPDHPATARALTSLRCHLTYFGKTAESAGEREAIARRLLRIGRERDQPLVHLSGWLGSSRPFGRDRASTEAQLPDARMAYDTATRFFPANAIEIAFAANGLATMLEAVERPAEAEPLRLEVYDIFRATPPLDRLMVHLAEQNIALNLQKQMRGDDARPWFARALAGYERAAAEDPDNRLALIASYAQNAYSDDLDGGERVYRALLARQEAIPGTSDTQIVTTLVALARIKKLQFYRSQDFDTKRESGAFWQRVIRATGVDPDNPYFVEASELLASDPETAPLAIWILRRAVERKPQDWVLLEQLGSTLMLNGEIEEALPIRERAIALVEELRGPGDRETLRLLLNMARQVWNKVSMARARPYYARTLAGYNAELAGLPENASLVYREELRNWISVVASEQIKLFWFDRANLADGGPQTALAQAFAVAQLAHPSSSASAIRENAGRAIAAREGKAELFDAWRDARDALFGIDLAIRATAEDTVDDVTPRSRLRTERQEAAARLDRAAGALRAAAPRVFSVLRPEPVPIEAIAGHGGRRALLRDNEALVLLYPGMPANAGEMSRGVVFAVTREKAAWAEIPLDGFDLVSAVEDLRFLLSPPPGVAPAGQTAKEGDRNPATFTRYDRQAAHDLYRALFGNPDIAAVLEGKPNWVLVPQGPLLSLPFSALVTRPPTGGAAGDIDPDELRRTGWLGLERAISVLPSVDTLANGRAAGGRRGGSIASFLGIGDPAFRGIPDGAGDGAAASAAAPAEVRSFYRSGSVDLAAIGQLARLEKSGREVIEIADILGWYDADVLLQMEATQSNIDRRNQAGRLPEGGLVVFATHALVAGDLGGTLAEPAIVLTPEIAPGTASPATSAPSADRDGLLTASEVAQLDFRSSLVILSACNTAAGLNGGEGFSGLARAFFNASAGSLVATHFPLLDLAGSRLTTRMVELLPDVRGDVPGAMRQAMREYAADTAGDATGQSSAHPAAWAAFVVMDPR
ncbi:CHAT domain-containing tetratricopeptide repeat protein [Parerythrobacter lacustris]|uniref:CHAT domain-containing protein n=1 Tax=Parerythrobacter lacustris TaxID=2969984 RepID=A0ABT1XT08_9SPHN|nr:CHAT domain-containing tetratricopeptide repeat protein [Parerythrobacter lacustris]MCR2834799.1 CHAT domain-containing protein [Parerythrobacter lacustris]